MSIKNTQRFLSASHFKGLVFFAAAALSSAARAQSVVNADGSFVFMDNYLQSSLPAADFSKTIIAAERVVGNLQALGSNKFLIPSLVPNDIETLGAVIEKKSGYFYTQERWSFEDANATGTFDCARFNQQRTPTLIRLKAKFPKTFRGLHLKDEPSFALLAQLGSMARCVRAVPELRNLELFLNLLPLATTHSGLANHVNLGYQRPDELGLDCSTGDIVNPRLIDDHVAYYNSYARKAMELIQPTYLAFDFYTVGQQYLPRCQGAAGKILSLNSRVIAGAAQTSGNATPISYLQNFCGVTDATCAQAAQLKWSSDIAMVNGIKDFAYFASHNFFDGGYFYGLFDIWNNPTGLYREAAEWNQTTESIRNVLSDKTFVHSVLPSLGLGNGNVVSNLNAFVSPLEAQFSAGEFHGRDGYWYVLITPNAPAISGQWTRVELAGRYGSVEMFRWGQFLEVGRNSNVADVWFVDNQAVLFRVK